MSIYNDTQELQKIFEDKPIFKAASKSQIARRPYDSIHTKKEIYGDILSDLYHNIESLYKDFYEESKFGIVDIRNLQHFCTTAINDLKDARLL